jgi:hypothetical protein
MHHPPTVSAVTGAIVSQPGQAGAHAPGAAQAVQVTNNNPHKQVVMFIPHHHIHQDPSTVSVTQAAPGPVYVHHQHHQHTAPAVSSANFVVQNHDKFKLFSIF